MADQSANPLLLEFLKEWWDSARERSSKGATTYKKAYDSMKACPLTFNHPSEAQQLQGLGPKLCDRLTERLKAHCTANGLLMPKVSRKSRNRLSADDLSLMNPPPPAKKARKSRPYVPAHRSGPYAIILTLSSLPEGSSAGLTKAQIVEQAQEHCDSSFTAPLDTSKFYTAWNSMKTLEDKDMVYEKGRPLRRYFLSEEGWEVAKRIRAVQELGILPKDQATNITDTARKSPAVAADFRHLDDIDNLSRPSATPLVSEETGNATTMQSGQQLGGSVTDKFGTFAEPRTRGFPSKPDFVEILSSPEPPLRSRPDPVGVRPSLDPSSLLLDSRSTSIPRQREEESPQRNSGDSPFPPTFQPIELQPGTFTVQLILDNREVRAKNDREYIQHELVRSGINPIVRPLQLGDFFWVAKCKDPSILVRHGEEGDEVALDWIVERKRLDDLVGSIKDGRFHEQKFRLRKSGVKNVVYVIEEFSMSSERILHFQEAIESSIASTQVVEGYFVKKTLKLDDTIRYLARMTLMLKSMYESKPIYIIPTTHLNPHTYIPLLSHLGRTTPNISHNITYAAFASLASKSDSLTLRDVFLKMLMCTRGVTGEKALEVQKCWKTPREFIEALEGCGGKKEREVMLDARLGGKVGRKKIGKTISGKIAEIWGEG
ncbi:Crossover junction endonuclease mus81 [Pseudocyphellaria aurata]|nr:Crossover junction endonuclease mus81 [Pseudocyphellaria aurata]